MAHRAEVQHRSDYGLMTVNIVSKCEEPQIAKLVL